MGWGKRFSFWRMFIFKKCFKNGRRDKRNGEGIDIVERELGKYVVIEV